VVILEALVSASGDVTDARVLKSIPALDDAAIEAVRQWRYVATTLNGVPVPVILTVTVNFTIDNVPSETVVMNSAPTRSDAAPFREPILAEWKGTPPIRVGGDVHAPERVKYVPPSYPIEAQQSKVSGIVIIQAIIDENGDVALAKVLKSTPLLDGAALEAVNHWKYTPTLVNGVPVPVVMTVTVNFTLRLH